jgi:hypothetical protein
MLPRAVDGQDDRKKEESLAKMMWEVSVEGCEECDI